MADPTMAVKIALRSVHLLDGAVWAGYEIGLPRRESKVLSYLGDGLSTVGSPAD